MPARVSDAGPGAAVAGANNVTSPIVPAATSTADLLHRYLQSAEVERRRKSDLRAFHLKHNAIRVLQPGSRRPARNGKARAHRRVGACDIRGPAHIPPTAPKIRAAHADHADAAAANTQRVSPALKGQSTRAAADADDEAGA